MAEHWLRHHVSGNLCKWDQDHYDVLCGTCGVRWGNHASAHPHGTVHTGGKCEAYVPSDFPVAYTPPPVTRARKPSPAALVIGGKR
jgi:hypothetical protein